VSKRFPRLKRYPRTEQIPLWKLKIGDKFEMVLDATTEFPYKRIYGEVIDMGLGSILVDVGKREYWSRETLVAEIPPQKFPRLK
jgi:hypothetical protein